MLKATTIGLVSAIALGVRLAAPAAAMPRALVLGG